MVRLAIVEDDKTQAENIKSLLSQYFNENKQPHHVQVYYSGIDLLSDYKADYDVILMDIEMPYINGMETAAQLRQIDGSVIIIFVTNMANYAIKGYEVDATGFIVKPLTYYSLTMNLQKALNFKALRKVEDIVVRNRNNLVVLSSKDVLYVEVNKHDLIFHTHNDSHVCRGILKELEERLFRFGFCRCSNSYLVNMAYVQSISENTVVVGDTELAISRNRKKDFVNTFMRFVGGINYVG